MKKRILVLILCLVLAVSLLPITAMADSWRHPETGLRLEGIEPCGTYRGDTYFSIVVASDCTITNVLGYTVSNDAIPLLKEPDGRYKIPGDSQIVKILISAYQGPSPNLTYVIPLIHDWQFTQTDSTLTGVCRNDSCPIGELSLTLKADSVTLPNSPFNAQLVGLEKFQEEVPDAVIGDFVYKYKGPGDSEFRKVDPTAANAKAGEYQVGVRIENLPAPSEQAPGVAARSVGQNPDSAGYADLYIKYTAADPAITAQTGDNRPIEIMMAGAAVFAALAAAAFILDSKRRTQQ